METDTKTKEMAKKATNKPTNGEDKKGDPVSVDGGALRYNEGKLRYDLVHARAHEDMVKVLTMGAKKYAERNWERGMKWSKVLESLKRHIAAIEKGEDYDPESGLLHIAHAACNVHFLNAYYYIYPQGDNRPKRILMRPRIGLDIDGVLADFATGWHDRYPEIEAKPNSWFFDPQIKQRFEKMAEDGELDEFYLNLPRLVDPKDIPFDPCCYVTSRPVTSEITKEWIFKNGYPSRPVITVPLRESKVQVCKDNNVEVFIDDSFENFIDLNNNGVLTYLYTTSWNERFDVGHMRVNSLKDIPLLQ